MTASLPDARIVVLNYNGEPYLEQCLPSIIEAAARSKAKVRVTVLDNQSQDASLQYLQKNLPNVEVVSAPQNRVLCSYNDYLAQIPEPVAILLNNDMRVDTGFIDPLLEKFASDPGTFMVAPKVMSFDGKQLEGARTVGKFRWGLFWVSGRTPGYEKEADLPSETFSSGFGAFSREKFLALGGYDDRYLPGIFEDIDLSWRAKQEGMRLYYEPRSVVYHMGQASFKKTFGKSKIADMAWRNHFLFLWKNKPARFFWLRHILFLPLRLVAAFLMGRWEMLRGFSGALTKVGKV